MDNLEENFDSGLFIDENYVAHNYKFPGGIALSLNALNTSSTDVDLTGQVVWTVSKILGSYICENRARFQGKRVLELGAGAGLSGLVASKFASECVLTDGSETVFKLLEQNVASHGGKESGLQAKFLSWGEELDWFDYTYPAGFDFIIGADIVQWTASIPALFQTVSRLLAPHSDARFIVAFVVRAKLSLDKLENAADEYGFTFSSVDKDAFMPEYTKEEREAQDYRLFEFRRKMEDE